MNTHIAEVRLLEAVGFAADKHRFQRRKDEHATPFINHPIKVACRLTAAGESDVILLMAALLHDTIEDTETTAEELAMKFGREVADLVLELTNDKHLSREEQRQQQLLRARHRSERARKIKLADKICNVYDILHHPPHGWSQAQKTEYILHAGQLVDLIRGTHPVLEHAFDELYRQATERLQGVEIRPH
ncbi:MAG: hypothetical protein RL021_1435 [Bacteroidota bacterium]|jgi:guanosine-3',5'-bis(diphosphate) 3'-pyrophosphohydrolase